MGALVSRLFGTPVARDDLRRLAGSPEQVLGAELLERADGRERGVRVVRLRSGACEVEVVVDRALDIAHASVAGLPVAWISPTGIPAGTVSFASRAKRASASQSGALPASRCSSRASSATPASTTVTSCCTP